MMTEHITSRRNPLLQHVKKLLSSRSYREKSAQFAAEGTKLLEEAAKWDAGLSCVIAQEGVALCPLPESVRVAVVPERVMREISQMEAPQGAIFICSLPQSVTGDIQPGSLILDGIQDPGNLGTILRTADALQVPVVLTEGCADAYNPKTVRASMGAIFRTKPVCMTRAQVAERCRAAGVPLLSTAMSADARDIRDADVSKAAVVIGSEGQGISQELFELSDGKLIIPMSERCESLNAAIAAAIVMWQMKR